MSNIKNVKIFTTTIIDKTMDLKSFYQDYKEEIFEEIETSDNKTKLKVIKQKFLENRINVGKIYGFDGRKIIIPKDYGKNYIPGSHFTADKKIYSKKEDLMELKITGDIVLLKKDNPGIVIAYPVSDDPVLIIEDKENGICALTHCNIDKISQRLPEKTISVLQKEAKSSVNNLKVYIGPHLKKEHNLLLIKPKLMKENPSVWKGCISKKSKKEKRIKKVRNSIFDILSYKIDQEKAIVNMLLKNGIKSENITVSDIDTYSDINYYSTEFALEHKEPVLEGKFLVGAYYSETFPEYPESKNVRSL